MTMREQYQIAKDEGVLYRTYLDSLNYPTGGIGHLLSNIEAARYPVGTAIPSSVVEEWFMCDMLSAIESVDELMAQYEVPYTDELHDILTNMAFNLGETRLRKFKRMWSALKEHDFNEAAKEMQDSRWYSQVGGRSKRLYERMRDLKGNEDVGKPNPSVGKLIGEDSTRPESGC